MEHQMGLHLLSGNLARTAMGGEAVTMDDLNPPDPPPTLNLPATL